MVVAGLRAESMLWELTDAFAGGGSYRWGCGRGHAAEKKALQTPFAHSDPTTEPSSMAKGPQQKDGFFTFLVRGTSMGTGTTSASRQP